MHAMVLFAILYAGMSYFVVAGAQGVIDILRAWQWRAYIMSPHALAQCCVPGCTREPRFTASNDPIEYVCGLHL